MTIKQEGRMSGIGKGPTTGGAGKGPGNAGKGGSAANSKGPGSKNAGWAGKSPPKGDGKK